MATLGKTVICKFTCQRARPIDGLVATDDIGYVRGIEYYRWCLEKQGEERVKAFTQAHAHLTLYMGEEIADISPGILCSIYDLPMVGRTDDPSGSIVRNCELYFLKQEVFLTYKPVRNVMYVSEYMLPVPCIRR